MKQYIKDGKIKFRNEIVIRKNGMQTINPSEEMLLADGWVEYEVPQPTPLTAEEQSRIDKQNEIRHLKEELSESDYKVIKCIEAYLCGEALPYDIAELHRERDSQRARINEIEL